jgi:hypothetical protein
MPDAGRERPRTAAGGARRGLMVPRVKSGVRAEFRRCATRSGEALVLNSDLTPDFTFPPLDLARPAPHKLLRGPKAAPLDQVRRVRTGCELRCARTGRAKDSVGAAQIGPAGHRLPRRSDATCACRRASAHGGPVCTARTTKHLYAAAGGARRGRFLGRLQFSAWCRSAPLGAHRHHARRGCSSAAPFGARSEFHGAGATAKIAAKSVRSADRHGMRPRRAPPAAVRGLGVTPRAAPPAGACLPAHAGAP